MKDDKKMEKKRDTAEVDRTLRRELRKAEKTLDRQMDFDPKKKKKEEIV